MASPEGALGPVFDGQTGDPLEFAVVVGHQHRAERQGVGGNERVQRADPDTPRFEGGSDGKSARGRALDLQLPAAFSSASRLHKS